MEPLVSEHVIIPPAHVTRQRGGFVPPLLILPLLVYNVAAFIFYGASGTGWASQLFTVPMVSQAPWVVTSGDLLLALGLVCLFIEVLKSTRSGSASIVEHMLSTLVFVVFLVEFLLVPAASTSVFFLLMLMSLMDVVAGFSVSITSAGRDVTMN